MSELSPAAQAVLDAAYREMDYAPRRHVQWVTAAALRAAADCLGYELLGVRVIDCSQLLLLADELESND